VLNISFKLIDSPFSVDTNKAFESPAFATITKSFVMMQHRAQLPILLYFFLVFNYSIAFYKNVYSNLLKAYVSD
jgi:hypothetical protein